jgi:hypothetical protein
MASVTCRLQIFYPTPRPSVLTSRRGFLASSNVHFQPIPHNMQEHCLDNPDVESFTIPGAKVFDRYFDLPIGEN